MNEPQGARRPRFQVGLATCLTSMLVAAVLMWANLHVRQVWVEESPTPYQYAQGWPWDAKIGLMQFIESEEGTYRMVLSPGQWYAGATILDATVALCLLAACVALCERYRRRREKARGGTQAPYRIPCRKEV